MKNGEMQMNDGHETQNQITIESMLWPSTNVRNVIYDYILAMAIALNQMVKYTKEFTAKLFAGKLKFLSKFQFHLNFCGKSVK